jgi:hypothetical protein
MRPPERRCPHPSRRQTAGTRTRGLREARDAPEQPRGPGSPKGPELAAPLNPIPLNVYVYDPDPESLWTFPQPRDIFKG